ncbi:MAG TPA: HAD-IC family P-type ATPase [Micropepsaceae bacterium]|nr:HAD-IC family P-type ATPase [Micropepsaceae bacterium]
MNRGDDFSASLSEAGSDLPASQMSMVAHNNPAPRRVQKIPIEIMHATQTRLRLRAAGLPCADSTKVRAALMGLTGIRSVAINPLTSSVIVHFSRPADSRRIISTLNAALRGKAVVAPKSEQLPAWHLITAGAAAKRLATSGERGLLPSAARQRLQKYGPNLIPKPQRRSDFDILTSQFNSLPVALLTGAGSLSIATGALLEAGAIFAVIAANGAIGFLTERQAERSIANLGIGGPRTCRVVRGGLGREVDVETLVPGDILELHGGMAIPADGRLISSQALTVSEAALTGESVPVHKSASAEVAAGASLADRTNMIYRGTIVTGGTGRAIVTATGAKTEIGAIQNLVGATATPQTPMQRELAQLGGQLGWLTLGATGVMGGLGILRRSGVLATARSSLALAVAAVPEGLPMVATTTLAFGAEALRRRGVLVRQMNAIEALASGQVICFDKTGTLTLNRMSLCEIAAGDTVWRLAGDSLADGTPDAARRDARFAALLRVACLNNDAGIEERNALRFAGSGTETALVRAAMSLGMDARQLRAEWPRLSTVNRTEQNRYMATIHSSGLELLVAVKGSPPDVVALCTDEMLPDGSLRALTDRARREIEAHNLRMAAGGLRVLGVAQKTAKKNGHSAEISNLVWLGCFGLSDELRPGVAKLMQRLHGAGVRTVLLTGDQRATAIAVARQTRMNGAGDIRALDGADLARMPEAEIATAVAGIDAFSRVSPTQKLHVIRGLQRAGLSVIMIGDGVNDAPALRAANVGLGIGRESTNAARDIAQAFIATDELEGLINAIEQGRTTYANIRKAIRYLLGTNLSEVLLMLGGALAGGGAALTPMQLLWINLITDVLPGIALALEPPEPGVMERAPSQSGSIFGTRDLKQLLGEGAVLAAGPMLAGLYGAARFGAGSAQSRTMAFGSLVTAQLLHAISCRSSQQGVFGPGKLPNNPWLNRTLLASGLAQAGAMLIPGLRKLMGIAPLDPASALLTAAAGIAPFVIRELGKLKAASDIRPAPPASATLPHWRNAKVSAQSARGAARQVQFPALLPESDSWPAIPEHAPGPGQTSRPQPAAPASRPPRHSVHEPPARSRNSRVPPAVPARMTRRPRRPAPQ